MISGLTRGSGCAGSGPGRRAVAAAVGGLRGGRVVGEEGGDLALVEAEVVDDRRELAQERVEPAAAAAGCCRAPARSPAGRCFETCTSGSRSLNRPRRSGASLSRSISVGRQLARGRPQLVDQRVGVLGELGQAAGGGAALAQEGRQHPEGVGQLGVAAGRSTSQTRFEFAISSRSWPWRSVSALEHLAGVAHSARVAPLWTSQHLEHVVGVLGERREVAERVVDRLAVAARRQALLVEPGARTRGASRGRTCAGSRRARRSRPPGRSGSVPPSASFGPLRRSRAQLHVGLAEQRLLAQDRARVLRRAARSARRSRSRRRSGRSARSARPSAPCPTFTPEMRTSASCASWVASGNATCTR